MLAKLRTIKMPSNQTKGMLWPEINSRSGQTHVCYGSEHKSGQEILLMNLPRSVKRYFLFIALLTYINGVDRQ